MSGLIVTGNIVTETEILFGGWIEVVSENIVRVERSDVAIPPSYGPEKITTAPWIVPGFVDIHNHGLGCESGDAEVLDHWLEPTYSQRELARCGTTSVLASLIFSADNPQRTADLCRIVEGRIGKFFKNAPCVIEGIHSESPIIRDIGGLPPQDSAISLDKFKELVSTMPSLKIMTISPSIAKPEMIQHLVDCGVRPSLGHDRHATLQQITACLAVRAPPDLRMHTTHYCNVMNFHHREPGLTNVTLINRFPTIKKYANCRPPSTEVIMDLVHVHSIAIQALLSARTPNDIAVISDALSAYEPGKVLTYCGRRIIVSKEGGCYIADKDGKPVLGKDGKPTLAGSTVTIADQFLTLTSIFGMSVVDAVKMSATTPAKIARIDHRVGSIAVGKKANLLLLNGNFTEISRRMIYGNFLDEFMPYRMLRPPQSHL